MIPYPPQGGLRVSKSEKALSSCGLCALFHYGAPLENPGKAYNSLR